jgi:hypothetical protein
MTDYTPLGIEKLTLQASRNAGLIRCPRDGVVMHIIRCQAARADNPDDLSQMVGRVPRGPDWTVRNLDLECPACRRRAMGVSVPSPRRESSSVLV